MTLWTPRGHRMTHRSTLGLREALLAKPGGAVFTGTHAQQCYTCLRDVDREEVVHTSKCGATVRMQCHGAEDVVTFDLGTEQWDHEDLARVMRGRKWFDPMTVAGGPQQGERQDGLDMELL